jgi:hypothetical protein
MTEEEAKAMIDANAAKPASASQDGTSASQHDLVAQIRYAKYLAMRDHAIQVAKIAAPSAVD